MVRKKTVIGTNRHGEDVIVFGTVEEAEAYIEPIDVRNGDWLVFDEEGRQLEASIVQRDGEWFERVVLSASADPAVHQQRLRVPLVEFLTSRGEPADQLSTVSFVDLVERALRYKSE